MAMSMLSRSTTTKRRMRTTPMLRTVEWQMGTVMAEREKRGPKYRVALRLAKDPRFTRLPAMKPGATYADDDLDEPLVPFSRPQTAPPSRSRITRRIAITAASLQTLTTSAPE